jgi:hypothetical protein
VRRASVIISHPLWLGTQHRQYWVEAQRSAYDASRDRGSTEVQFCDLWSLERRPDALIPLLTQAPGR